MVRLGLIDYGMGNMHSVQQAFFRLGRSLELVKSPLDLNQCDALILPGVGSFDPAMGNLEECKLVSPIRNWAKEGKPLLGICLGLQLLFEGSDEGQSEGLGIFKGQVRLLPDDVGERIPHMGWSPLIKRKSCPLFDEGSQDWMYFVHSYAAFPSIDRDIAATTCFGQRKVTAVVWKKRLGACQFHPEKSSLAGQGLLANWLNWLDLGAPAWD
ncbi:imidazole glycerol phosphate synthase subunit HisH [Prochlorococcus sp. MIT 1341]|uniref:imidazole glycerol phosphate synthase subunit HisH n=1 Tax=Prochlorococcus sp. MIT 1341 TaxID=3096221 RepID=UPI0039BF5D88